MISARIGQPALTDPDDREQQAGGADQAQPAAGHHELVRAINTLLSIQRRSAAALEVAHLEDDATLTSTRAQELLA